MRKLLLLAGLVLAAGQVQADSGSELLEYCSAPETFLEGVCLGYVMGIEDAHDSLVGTRPFYCLSAGVSKGQLELIVKKFLQENPEKLHLSAGTLVILALMEAFPCK